MIKLTKTIDNNSVQYDQISNEIELNQYLSWVFNNNIKNVIGIEQINKQLLTIDVVKQLLLFACECNLYKWTEVCLRTYMNSTLDNTYYDLWDNCLCDYLSETCLIKSCENEAIDLLEILLEYGITPNAAINEDYFALGIVIQKNNYEMAKLLIENGADVNQIYYLDCYPIHMAIMNNNYDITKLLLDNGASPNCTSKHYANLSALEIAIKYKHDNIVELLMEYGGTFSYIIKS